MAVMGSMACEASIQQRTGINGQMTEILALYKKIIWSLLLVQKYSSNFYAEDCVPGINFSGDCLVLVYLMGMG